MHNQDIHELGIKLITNIYHYRYPTDDRERSKAS